MEKKPIQLILNGSLWNVDVAQECLEKADNKHNKIRYEDMDFKQTHYEFDYDPVFQNIQSPFDEPNGVVKVNVPVMLESDPEGMCAKYNLVAAQLSDEEKFILHVHEPEIVARLKGKLPVVSVEHARYQVDLAKGLLLPLYRDDLAPIELYKFKLSPDGKSQECLYDTKTGKAYSFGYPQDKLPEHLSLLKIPVSQQLDSFAIAEIAQQHWLRYVVKYPPAGSFLAEVKPVQKPGLDKAVKKRKRKGHSI